MAVKSIAVLAIVVMVVAGFAVNGSRAQPVPGVSVAALQCQTGTAPASATPCRPLVSSVNGALEREMAFDREAADDDGDPDWHWQQLAARVVVVVASWFAEHFGRAYVPDAPEGISEAIFDASR